MTSSKLTEYPYYNTNFVIQKTKCEHFQTICCRVKSVGGGWGGGFCFTSGGFQLMFWSLAKKTALKKVKPNSTDWIYKV